MINKKNPCVVQYQGITLSHYSNPILMDFGLPQHIFPGAFIQFHPLRRLPHIPASNMRLTGASFSIRTTWLSQRSHWILMSCTMPMSLRMKKSVPTLYGSKIFYRIFLSNSLKATASVLNRAHASTSYRSTGRVSVL